MANRRSSERSARSEDRSERSERSSRREFKPVRLLETIEEKLSEHPQIGTVVLEGLVLACGRVAEYVIRLEEELRHKIDELKGDEGFESTSSRSRGSGKMSQSTQEASM